ncbi:MAG: GTP pyrophosphokinase [Anaerovoracaceae bacterium]|jgi:hypothetical protein
MLYTPMTKKAMQVMVEKHRGQLDRSGLPYMFHPWHVAESMTDEISASVALLHDVLEDTDCTEDELRADGFPDEVILPLLLLTRRKGADYYDYIENLAPDSVARRVKLSDLHHNSDTGRLDKVTEEDRVRLDKYKRCIDYLSHYEEGAVLKRP